MNYIYYIYLSLYISIYEILSNKSYSTTKFETACLIKQFTKNCTKYILLFTEENYIFEAL